ncbi:MAG TPA: hypothetical protein VFZ21_23030, partial [Gemmatimonadaceae bacterium]|nr:hypothetical protein [Gemmatimonadaceae bacterium]
MRETRGRRGDAGKPSRRSAQGVPPLARQIWYSCMAAACEAKAMCAAGAESPAAAASAVCARASAAPHEALDGAG